MIGAFNSFQIDEVFTRPVKRLCVPLGMAFSFSNARDGFSEGFPAGFAPEPSLSNEEGDAVSADGRVFNADVAVIVGGVTCGGTPGAVLKLRAFKAAIGAMKALSAVDVGEF